MSETGNMMAFYNTITACSRREKKDLPPKNRVGDFFATPTHRARRLDQQTLAAHRENQPAPTKTASGLSCWLARDPIEEKAGLHLYAFVQNDPEDGIDAWGLTNDVMGPHGPVGPSTPYLQGPEPTQVGGALEMFLQFLYGRGDVVVSREMQQQMRDSRDVDAARLRLKSDLKKFSICNFEDSYSTETTKNVYPFSILTGSWQLRMTARCDWNCGKIVGDGKKCYCDCTAQCHLRFSYSKLYTFSVIDENNLQNAVLLPVQLFGRHTHFGFDPSYRITGFPWDENYSPAYRHEVLAQ